MTTLTDQLNITRDTYLHDRIEIKITGLAVAGRDSAFYTSLGFLENLRSIAAAELPDEIELFNRPTGGYRRTMCTVSQTARERAKELRPLFTAELETITRSSQHTQSVDPAPIRLNILFNPTRFVRHWLTRTRALEIAATDIEIIPLHELFSRRRIVSNFKNEFANARRDNVILSPLQWHWLTTENRDRLLILYINSVVAALQDLFNRAARAVDAHIIGDPKYTLLSVETYWEQTHVDVYDALAQVQANLMRYGRFKEHQYRNMTSHAVRQNERSIAIEAGPGVHLAVYAKTNKRIRFELRQYCSKQREGRTADSLEELLDLIYDRTEMAVANASELEKYTRTYPTQPPLLSDLFGFLHEFYSRFDDHEDAAHILILLVANGHIEIQDLSSSQRKALNRLTTANILIKSGRGVRAVNLNYLTILNRLSNWNMIPDSAI